MSAKASGKGKIPLKVQRCGRVMERVRTVQHERLTIQEAAHRLGVSESAIRKRIKRGTLKREKTEDGRVLVYMEPSAPGTEEVRTPERDALISQMQERVAFLEHELEVRSEEIRRRDTIIMNMTEAMKALSPPSQETPPDERDSPQTAEEEPERAEPPGRLLEGLRRAYSGRGGVGCSEDEREGLADVKAHAKANPDANPDSRNPSRLSVGSGAQHRPEARRGRVRCPAQGAAAGRIH